MYWEISGKLRVRVVKMAGEHNTCINPQLFGRTKKKRTCCIVKFDCFLGAYEILHVKYLLDILRTNNYCELYSSNDAVSRVSKVPGN